jgi:hypothetical protein
MLVKGSAAAKAFMAKLRAAKGKKKPSAKKVGGAHDATIEKLQDVLNFYTTNLKTFEKIYKNKKYQYAKKPADIIMKNKILDEIEKNKKVIENKKNEIKILKNLEVKQQTLNFETKKPAAKKRPLKTGFSNKEYDIKRQAKAPGKRISKEGNKYTENRENRSDKGKLLGIGSISKSAMILLKDRSELYEALKNVSLVTLKSELKYLKGADKTKKMKAIKEMSAYISTLKKEITMLKKHI